jgi:hypothetical protein
MKETATLPARPSLGHPFAQGADGDFPADDDEGDVDAGAVQIHQHDQRGGHHELVGHRIEEGAEGGHLVQAARQPAIQPVGDGGQGEDQRWR